MEQIDFSSLKFEQEKKKIYENFFEFLADLRITTSNVPLKKRDLPLNFKLKEELKNQELPNFEEITKIFLKTQERDKKFKSKWQKEEIELIIFVIFYYTKKLGIVPENYEREHWQFVSKFFLERSWKQCWLKWRNLLRFNPLSKKWSKDEDSKLSEIVRAYETNSKPLKWTRIADELFEKGVSKLLRLGKHCRERWNNHLNPLLNKGEWSDEEDIELITLILKLQKKWSQISREMQGRNEYSVKNRFYYLMKINKLDSSSVTNEELQNILDKKKEIIEGRRLKSLQETLNLTNQIGNNTNNGLYINPSNLQNFLVNYQNFVHFQSFCLYRKNIENFFANFSKIMKNPDPNISDIELRQKLLDEKASMIGIPLKKEDFDVHINNSFDHNSNNFFENMPQMPNPLSFPTNNFNNIQPNSNENFHPLNYLNTSNMFSFPPLARNFQFPNNGNPFFNGLRP